MWVTLSFVSLFAIVARNFLTKKTVDSEGPYAAGLITYLFGLPLALILAIIFGLQVNDPSFWLLLIFRVAINTFAFILVLKAYKYRSITYVSALLTLQPIVVAVFGSVLRGDVIDLHTLIAIGVITLSCLLMYVSEVSLSTIRIRSVLHRSTVFVLIAVVIYGFLDPLHTLIISRANEFSYLFLSDLLFVIIFSIILLKGQSKPARDKFLSKPLRSVVLSLIAGVETLALFFALKTAPTVAAVATIRSTNVVLIALISAYAYKEKSSPLKWLAVGGVLVGVIILGL